MVATLTGTGGDDTLHPVQGQPVNAGAGNDVVFGPTDAGHVTYNGQVGDDYIYAGTGDAGTNGPTIRGDAGNDVLIGDAGSNNISGGTGNDTLRGGAGNDTLEGGTGSDNLTGGAGSDRFVFDYARDGNLGQDTITDFTLGTDLLLLSGTQGSTSSTTNLDKLGSVSDFQNLINLLNANPTDHSYASAHGANGQDVWFHFSGLGSILCLNLNANHVFTGLT